MAMAAKTEKLTANGARKKKLLRRNPGDLEAQTGVGDAMSPTAALGTTDPGNDWGRGHGTASVGREIPAAASKSAFPSPGRPA